MKIYKNGTRLVALLMLVLSMLTAPVSITAHAVSNNDSVIASRFLELFFGKTYDEVSEDIYLCPGGEAFGVKVCGDSVTVSKTGGKDSGTPFCENDAIKSINGKPVHSIADVKEMLAACGGNELSVSVIRGGRSLSIKVVPRLVGDEYCLGVVLKDTTTGIGTITYYDPATHRFGGLGHGISTRDGKDIINMARGTVTSVILAGASRGVSGVPGELRGVLTDKIIGTLDANTECGVFGTLDAKSAAPFGAPIAIAKKCEVNEGNATVITTVKSGSKRSFNVEIFDVDFSSDGTKSFKIKVTDDALIAITGGIVRGMSGSPIIQNGKLVGAVTHVLINDPTTGYGIFIENMLGAAQMPMQNAA